MFFFTNSVSASAINTLQPASTQYIHEELQVLGTARAYSIRVGAQGYGGVTFFNGTIINETTDTNTGAEMPVTFGDDVRIDGELFRTEVGGDHPIKLSDTIRPQTTATYDLGSSSNEFRHGYFSGNLTVGGLVGTGIVSSNNIANGAIGTVDIANGAVGTVNIANNAITSAKINNETITSSDIKNNTITGSDILSTTNLNVNRGTFTGDIIQSIGSTGAIKAAAYVIDGDCSNYQWTYNNDIIACQRTATGEYTLTFDFITNQGGVYYQIIPTGDSAAFSSLDLTSASTPSNDVIVHMFAGVTSGPVTVGEHKNHSFIITVY